MSAAKPTLFCPDCFQPKRSLSNKQILKTRRGTASQVKSSRETSSAKSPQVAARPVAETSDVIHPAGNSNKRQIASESYCISYFLCKHTYYNMQKTINLGFGKVVKTTSHVHKLEVPASTWQARSVAAILAHL